MKHFSLPADFKTETIDSYSELNSRYPDSRVIETYGQVTKGSVLNSGRIINLLPDVDFQKLSEYADYSRKQGIDFNYTLNPACMGNLEFTNAGVEEIHRLLNQLYHMGIYSLTITTPSLIELVKATGKKFKIKASAICEITTPDKAMFYKEIGVDKLVVDPDVTRHFDRIKRICQVFEKPVEIIINNVCYKNCAYKMFHYNHEAHCTMRNEESLGAGEGKESVTDYFVNRCAMQKAKDLKNIIRLNWIRPEDLKLYAEAGIQSFKIQGRQNVMEGEPVKALEAYMKEDFDGNLYDLITLFAPYTSFQPYIDNKKLEHFVKKFYEEPGFCKDTCASCRYCEGFLKKSVDLSEAADLNQRALTFFKECDGYLKMIHKKENIKPVKKLFDGGELDCEFNY